MPARPSRVIAPCALAALGALGALGCGDDADTRRIDAGPPPDASTIDAAVGVVCGDAFCPIERHCCSDQINPPRVSNFCVDDGLLICQGVAYQCDGPEDCAPGEICCASGSSTCTLPGDCQGFVACHLTEHCPAPLTCQPTPCGIIRACL